jgi:hypothetical protein
MPITTGDRLIDLTDPFPKINLSRDYDETARTEQKAFLMEMGPYRSLAAKDSKLAFLRRVRTLWFLRWPLQLGRYLDHEGMRHRKEQIWKVSIFPFLNFSNSDTISRQSIETLCGQESLPQ